MGHEPSSPYHPSRRCADATKARSAAHKRSSKTSRSLASRLALYPFDSSYGLSAGVREERAVSEIQPFETKARPANLAELYTEELTGEQRLYRFDNGFGASVVRSLGTYGAEAGQWELAVVVWKGDDFDITYDTPIADDVIGWLDDDEVQEKLRAIRDLPGAVS